MAESLSEQVARLERTLADAERERDGFVQKYDEAKQRASALLAHIASVIPAEWEPNMFRGRGALSVYVQDLRSKLAAAESALSAAKREGAREALNRCLGYLDANSLYMASVDIKEIRDREYPAVPPEREGSGNLDPRCVCGHFYSNHSPVVRRGCCAALSPLGDQICECVEFRPTPPQAAPEPLCDQCLQPLSSDESRDHDNPKRHTIRGCNRALGRAMQRIIALASRPTASGEG